MKDWGPDKYIDLLEEKLGYVFNDRTNISYIIIDKKYRAGDKHRLCTLGDSVLGLAIVDYLYHEKPDKTSPEELTNKKQELEKNEYLTKVAMSMKLDECLDMDDNERKQWDEMKIAAGDLVEGIIGALYLDLDRDFAKCREIVCDVFLNNSQHVFPEKKD